MKTLRLLAPVFLLPLAVVAGDIEYGKPEELAGVTKIFVDTEGNLELRNNIVSEIFDDLEEPYPLAVVDRIEEAEVALVVYSTINRRGNAFTEISAIKIDNEKESLRLVWQWGDENPSRFGRRPSSRAADRFVAEWKKFNGDKLPPAKKR